MQPNHTGNDRRTEEEDEHCMKPRRPYFIPPQTEIPLLTIGRHRRYESALYRPDYAKNPRSADSLPTHFLYSIYWAAQAEVCRRPCVAFRRPVGILSAHPRGRTFTYTNELVDVQVKESQMAGKLLFNITISNITTRPARWLPRRMTGAYAPPANRPKTRQIFGY